MNSFQSSLLLTELYFLLLSGVEASELTMYAVTSCFFSVTSCFPETQEKPLKPVITFLTWKIHCVCSIVEVTIASLKEALFVSWYFGLMCFILFCIKLVMLFVVSKPFHSLLLWRKNVF